MQNVEFDLGSVYALPYANASFDAVFANTLLQHLADPSRALTEIRRVLKPGGVVGLADDDHSTLVWEPRTPALTEAHRLIARVIAHKGGDVYRARQSRRLLLEAGFVRVTGTNTLGTGGASGVPRRDAAVRGVVRGSAKQTSLQPESANHGRRLTRRRVTTRRSSPLCLPGARSRTTFSRSWESRRSSGLTEPRAGT